MYRPETTPAPGPERRDTTGPIRVVIADDDRMTRLALGQLIASDPGLELVGVAEDAAQAIALARRHRPDVALLDVDMPGGGGAAATRGIGDAGLRTRVAALSGSEERAAVVEMLRAGAVGYLVKGTPVAELLEGIRRTARGERALSESVVPEVAGELADQLAAQEDERVRLAGQEAAICRIVDEGLLTMVFQPIVDLATGAVTALEALARFEMEPRQGPHIWFAQADEVGLRAPLELTAIRAALAALDDIPAQTALAVNVSPATILTGALTELIGPAAERVVVEITEHAPVEDYDALTAAMAPLRAAGTRVAIDDAGAGFASLRHILLLAPDVIKIDMALTQRVVEERAPRALTSALTFFAREIDAAVVAEGVETPEQMDALRSLGVSHAQGYHLGRPGPLQQVLGAGAVSLVA